MLQNAFDVFASLLVGAAVDPLRNLAYFVVSNEPVNGKDGQEIHLYALNMTYSSGDLKLFYSRHILIEQARNHIMGVPFVEGFTIDAKKNELYVHVHRGATFMINPSTGAEKKIFEHRIMFQPSFNTYWYDSIASQWFIYDLTQNFIRIPNTDYWPQNTTKFRINECNGRNLLSSSVQIGTLYLLCASKDHGSILREIFPRGDLGESTIRTTRLDVDLNTIVHMVLDRDNIYLMGRKMHGFNLFSHSKIFESKYLDHTGNTFVWFAK